MEARLSRGRPGSCHQFWYHRNGNVTSNGFFRCTWNRSIPGDGFARSLSWWYSESGSVLDARHSGSGWPQGWFIRPL